MKKLLCLLLIPTILVSFSGCYKASPGASAKATSPGAPVTVKYRSPTASPSAAASTSADPTATPAPVVELDAIVGMLNADGAIKSMLVAGNEGYESVDFQGGYKPDSFVPKTGQKVRIRVRLNKPVQSSLIMVPEFHALESITLIADGIPQQYIFAFAYSPPTPVPPAPPETPTPSPTGGGYNHVTGNSTIKSSTELKNWFDVNDINSTLTNNATMIDLINNRYSAVFFESNFLVIMTFWEGDMGIVHAVTDINTDGIITVKAARLGGMWPTMMAGFHMILELPRDTYPVKEYRIDYLAN